MSLKIRTLKRPIPAFVSAALLIVAIAFAVERIAFLMGSVRTTARVTGVSSFNAYCGGGRSSWRRPCTMFLASATYLTQDNIKYSLRVPAGHAEGNDQALEKASLKVNDQVPIVYNPQNPGESRVDSFWEIWRIPLAILFFQLCALFVSLAPRRR